MASFTNNRLLFFFVFLFFHSFLFGQVIKSDSLACDTFPPPRNLDGYTQDDAVNIWWEVPILIDTVINSDTSYIKPKNLLGYHVYMDNELHEYVEYDGNDTSFLWIMNFNWPGCFDFETTALYDLSLCGSIGDTIESARSNLKELCVEYSFPFPFVEDWSTGSFDPNLWDADEYWSVDGNYGFPPPCAVFNYWSDTSYYQKLESYANNCRDHSGTNLPYIDGDFYLEFELMSINLTMPGTSHHLDVEICTDSSDWQVVKAFVSSGGSFHNVYKLNITDIVKGHYMRFRFVAYRNSGAYNYQTWMIDNIALYRECNPPRDLQWITAGEHMVWSPPLPHSTKEFSGYNVYAENNLVEFTTDTFYTFNPPLLSGPIYVKAVYEDCGPVSNFIWGNVGVEEKESSDIKLYPNPAYESIYVAAVRGGDEETGGAGDEFRVSSILGITVLSGKIENNPTEIDISGLMPGIYVISIITERGYISKKFIIRN